MTPTHRLKAVAALALVAAALGSASAPAEAAWLRQEWRNYRSYPRLSEAERLYKLKRFAEARSYVEQVERIDPDSVDAAVLKFEICEQQRDLDCIRELAGRWQSRRPDSGLGPAMQAYIAYVERRPEEMTRLAQAALNLPGLTPDARSALGSGWVAGLIQLGRSDEAADALRWLEAHKVKVSKSNRQAWQTAIAKARNRPALAAPEQPAAAAAPPAPRPPAPPPSAPRPPAPAPQRAASPTASATPPSARRQAAPRTTAAPLPPARPPALPPPPPETEVLALINEGRYPEAVSRIQQLDAEGRLDARTREGLVLNLQRGSCASVLQLVPPEAAAPLTTARQQMAAGYCSDNDREAARALRHFTAARSLAGDNDPTLAAQALGGQASAKARLGDAAAARAALAEAIRLAPADAQLHAAYGYQLKAAGDERQAKEQFETALELDGQRTELMAELAFLTNRLNQPDESIRWGRSAIDNHADISQRLQLDDDEAQRRLFSWRRAVQTEEDRFSWYANAIVRLDHGPSGQEPLSPVDYAQYGGSLNAGAAYRYTPLGAQLPTWAFARTSQGLEDRSLETTPDNVLVGAGIRQRLSKDYFIVASAEYLWRKSAVYKDDAMLRLSGSHTWGGDWNPVDAQWTYANIYGDLAWLVRQRSHFTTFTGDLGRMFALPGVSFKAAVMPYLTTGYAGNNDGIDRVEVTRFDVGFGVALLSWHQETSHRAPAINQRLALEFRRTVAGNTTDRQTVQLKWIIQH